MPVLHILHVLRAPLGGLFRHVVDLARGQIARGHRVGIIADSLTGNARSRQILAELAPELALGLTLMPVAREPGLRDVEVVRRVGRRLRHVGADIVHGHGAKGGAYARLAVAGRPVVRAYTPHGGSLLFTPESLRGRAYLALERALMRRGHLYFFESAFAAALYRAKVGVPSGLARVIPNGVDQAEFAPVEPDADASDLLFVGELRAIKGVDVLLEAVARLARDGLNVTATLVGDGPEGQALRERAARLAIDRAVTFLPAMPMRQALARGRLMVVPSHLESMPYVVLEAAAAGRPLVATRVGGIPEIFGALAHRLVPPGDPAALAQAIRHALADPAACAADARILRARVAAEFSVGSMVEGVLEGYAQALERLRTPAHALPATA